MTDSLHRRLMYLSNLVYALSPGTIVLPAASGESARRAAAIGLAGAGRVIGRNFTGGVARDLALIDRIPEGLVIAVRGTMPPDPRASPTALRAVAHDWLNDGNLFDAAASKFTARVHGGFAAAALALCDGDDGLNAQLNALLAATGMPAHIYVTGHSKGGPVANLIAWAIRAHWGLSSVPVSTVTFAAARAGNAAFRADFNARGINATRYEVALDIVPRLPLGNDHNAALRTLLDQLGIGTSGAGVGFVGIGAKVEENWLEAIRRHAGDLVDLGNGRLDFLDNLKTIVLAHSIAPDTAYDALVT